ncbi:SAM-dependent methyltransferase [Antarcticirhabdus aurantiaca]|uniref:Cyclopropane-fatty-acyl-phospholipid synthase n=1 Tax=Antarcticirhabdus aurantiaca TaxID=2606717 RepID=A0ACD4NUM5_9HYPH|nr:cyclopropane-fatty-acyl-phospholipid synthase family protein [Antarcticirhabdus aurantiaca]WAJ30416.1 cyclopropane-fatty-acyl-phospholipid synthase [Jeongeuplla avenae]
MNPILSLYVRHLVREGTLLVTDSAGRQSRWGDGSGKPVHVRLKTRAAERAVALNPGLAFPERYMDGEIDMVEGTIHDLLALVFRNAGTHATDEPWMRAAETLGALLKPLRLRNTPGRSRRNVEHHYDLSGALYDLFLDADRQYSCAYFESPADDLETAQLAKKRHIAAKLHIDRPDLSVLDIGCGWGGLGLYLARHCASEVTGITLSTEQEGVANRRAEDQGLAARARFRIEDYRHTAGRFDRIVSVGMFEHVGPRFYADYFGAARRLLADDGVMLLHTIGRLEGPAETNAFIAKHIFPGGTLPALSEILPATERAGLVVTDVEVLRLHYAETLKAWRLRFAARREEAKALYDERFCRMWEFYLSAAECGFRWQNLVVFQIQLARRIDALPVTRDYIAQAESRLRLLDGGAARPPVAAVPDARLAG